MSAVAAAVYSMQTMLAFGVNSGKALINLTVAFIPVPEFGDRVCKTIDLPVNTAQSNVAFDTAGILR